MSDDVKRSEGEPFDRKTRIANSVAESIDQHAEYHDGDRAIVIITSDIDQSSGIGLFGFEADVDAMVQMFMTLRAIAKAAGKDIKFIGIPDSPEGIDG